MKRFIGIVYHSSPWISHEICLNIRTDLNITVGAWFGDTQEDIPRLTVTILECPRWPPVVYLPFKQATGTGSAGSRATPEGKRETFFLGSVEDWLVPADGNCLLAIISPLESYFHCQTSLVQSPSGHRIS